MHGITYVGINMPTQAWGRQPAFGKSRFFRHKGIKNTGNVQFRLKHYGFPIELDSAEATKSELDKKVELLYPMCIIIPGSANCGVSVKRIVKL